MASIHIAKHRPSACRGCSTKILLRSMEICEKYLTLPQLLNIPAERVFVFNEDFIKNQVQIKEEGLDAIVLLGERVDIEEAIEKKRSEHNEIKKESDSVKSLFENTYNSPRSKLAPLYIMTKIKEKLKENGNWVSRKEKLTNRRVNVTDNAIEAIFENHRPISANLQDAIEQYNSVCNIIENSQRGTFDEQVELLSVSENLWTEIDLTLAKKIEEPVITERDKLIISIYSNRGKNFFDDITKTFSDEKESVCPFCFRDVSSDEKVSILENIKAALSEIAKEHEAELKLSKDKIDSLIKKFSEIQNDADKLKNIFSEDFITFNAHSHTIDQLLAECSQQLEDKINRIYLPIEYTSENIIPYLNELNASISRLEEDRIRFNEQIEKGRQNLDKAIILNDDIAYWELNDRYNEYKQAQKTYDELSDKIKSYNEKMNNFQTEIDHLNAQKRQINIAADKINKSLQYIFMCQNRLEIEVENDTYYLKSYGQRVAPDKISTGERNIIALCYFFLKIIENSNSSDNYSSECLLVIDDPVSSFDMENKVGIISYLNLKISEIFSGSRDSKVVILSHDYQTVFDLGKIADEIKSKYNISFTTSELKDKQLDIIKRSERNQYSQLMKEVYKYANNKSEKLSDFTVGNSIRRLLEAYATFVYNKGIKDLSSDDAIMNSCGEYKDFYRTFMFRLILNGESHYEEKIDSQNDINFFNSFSPEQLKDTAKKIICFLYILNPDHVRHHLKDSGNSLGNFEDQIRKWEEDIR